MIIIITIIIMLLIIINVFFDIEILKLFGVYLLDKVLEIEIINSLVKCTGNS